MGAKDRIRKGCDGIFQTDIGCWIWNESLKNGYGQLSWKGKNTYAHRLSYESFNGGIPPGGLVCHKCHNRLCVNPSHLYIGDKKTNAQDMLNNGDGKNGSGKYDMKTVITNGVQTLVITNQAKFCKENGLNRGNFNSVIHGIRSHCKGWRLAKC
jgi:hypothetical protein